MNVPDVLPALGTIRLEPDEPYMYISWGFRYRLTGSDKWTLANVGFRKKTEADEYMKSKYLRYKDMEGEVIPVKRTMVLQDGGSFKSWTEPLEESD